MISTAAEFVDVAAWTGHWPTFALPGRFTEVVEILRGLGVGRILLSPLDGALSHNLHRANNAVFLAAQDEVGIYAVPLLDPTLPTWESELEVARDSGSPMVRWLPAYSGFDLQAADLWAETIADSGLALGIQLRLEDVRRQHRGLQVGDVPLSSALALAKRHPELALVIGGGTWTQLLHHAEEILSLPRVYADCAHVDGVDSLLRMVERGLAPRLLFGSHVPFFIALAGVARLVHDLNDEDGQRILGENAMQLLWPEEGRS
ncbi:MAG: hypothetical protein VYB08_16375 [Candidatus Latescibacterota bacterium]|nr:hypothetical protein [Candidatus Latescibacterota bacterium]